MPDATLSERGAGGVIAGCVIAGGVMVGEGVVSSGVTVGNEGVAVTGTVGTRVSSGVTTGGAVIWTCVSFGRDDKANRTAAIRIRTAIRINSFFLFMVQPPMML